MLLEELLDHLATRVAAKVRTELGERPVQPRLFTIEQAATYLGRTKEAIKHMVHVGKLPAVKPDRRISIDRHDLDRWIEDNKVDNGSRRGV